RSVNLDSNRNIQVLNISKNHIAQIGLTTIDSLKEFDCSDNNFITLELDQNKNLSSLNCSNNLLEQLNISNGNNHALTLFHSVNNAALYCIEIDDPAVVNEEWLKDETASYSTDCHFGETYVPDDNFEAYLSFLTGVPDNNDNYILRSSIDTLSTLDISSRNITDLTGIEDFTSLQILDLSHNNIGSARFDTNTSLV